MTAWVLTRNVFGKLVLTDAGGKQHVGVVPVRAFPIAAPDEGVAVVAASGTELAWIEHLSAVEGAQRALIEEELAIREFVPEILTLLRVSSFATPSTWTVETDRGETQFVLRGEEDIRRLQGNMLMIGDSHGIQYRIVDLLKLDAHSRRLLDRFL